MTVGEGSEPYMVCSRCDEPIDGNHDTIPHVTANGLEDWHYHPECSLRMMIGGLNHILGRCTCCGGTEPPDPPDMTPRQAAVAAIVAWRRVKSTQPC